MKVETSQAINLVKRGATPRQASEESGCPLPTLYAALRQYYPLPKKRKDRRASLDDVTRWINERLELGFSHRVDAAEAYQDFREFIGYDWYMPAMDVNKYLRLLANCHMVRSNGRTWVVGARFK